MRSWLLTLLLAASVSTSASACLCSEEALNAQMTSATQVVRVKIVSRTAEEEHWPFRLSEQTVYRAELLESIKPSNDPRSTIEVRSATSSCELYLAPGEEWLLLIQHGHVHQCGGHALLSGANARLSKLVPKDPMYAERQYSYAAARLAAVRELARESQPPQTSSDGPMQTVWRTLRLMAGLAEHPVVFMLFSCLIQLLTFIPIVAGEAAMASRTLDLPYRNAVKPIAIANFWSTFVGVPLAWFAMILLGALSGAMLSVVPAYIADSEVVRYVSFPLFAAWIKGDSRFEIRVAFLILMAVFCWVSIIVQRRVLARYLPTSQQPTLGKYVRQANIASYLVVLAVALIAFGL
jgi:hypothetical protein